MSESHWVVEALANRHRRDGFASGRAELDDYLDRYAGQDERRDLTRVFVAVEAGQTDIAGYYSLSAGSVERRRFPPERSRKLPHYPVPMARLGRLAVDMRLQGQGLGSLLLLDALKRSLSASASLGVYGVMVDALDERAATFYQHFGFVRLSGIIRFELGIHREGFNVFALGPTGLGKTSTVKEIVTREAEGRPVPDDWCYAHNFDEPSKPKRRCGCPQARDAVM
ncbi:GNAT family N-acetyltransferase [Methylomagnum sp.]